MTALEATEASLSAAPTQTQISAPAAQLRSTRGSGLARSAAGFGIALAIFALFMLAKKVNPLQAYIDMVRSTFTDWTSLSDVLIRACPIIFAALAVSVPARAGLVNVGGEGQIYIGAITASWVALNFGDLPAPILIPALLSGLIIGMVQAATSINEQTLSFIPKLIVVAISIMVFGSMILGLLSDFTLGIFERIPDLVR